MAVKFNERVKIAEYERGPGIRGDFAGGYVDIIRQYSDQLKNVNYSPTLPTDIDVNTLVNIRDKTIFEKKPRDMIIENWHVKPDGCVYQGNKEHSSVVIRIEGNVVHTAGGSRYVCIKRDPNIRAVMNILASVYNDYTPFDSKNPFHPDSLPLLFTAELLVYGRLAAKKDQILQQLSYITRLGFRLKFGEKSPLELVNDMSA